MDLKDYKEIVEKYKSEYPEDWIGIHDCHYANGTAEKIEQVGLCVSYNAYGRKGYGLPLERNFMATMQHINTDDEIFTLPVCPIFIRIPRQIVEALGGSVNDSDLFKAVCTYGFMERPYEAEDGSIKREVRQVETKEKANINLLPSFLIEGHIDMQTSEFVQNPLYFENLPQQEQEKILTRIMNSLSSGGFTQN